MAPDAVVSVVVTFTYPSTMTRTMWMSFDEHQRTEFMTSLENSFHNDIDMVIQEMIRDEEYTIHATEA